MPAIVAKQLNELGKVRVQTEGFRDATDVVMESVSCDLHAIGNAAIQGLNCREFGNFGRRRTQRCGSKPLFQTHNLPFTPYCGGQRAILACYLKPFFEDAMVLTLPTRRAPLQPARPTACSL
jgi:hypothetical protein